MLGFLLGSLFIGSVFQEQQNTKNELEKLKRQMKVKNE